MDIGMRATTLLLALAFSSAAYSAQLPRAGAACDQIPEPHRWSDAGTPDVGARPPLLSAHRGGVNLAPENTLAAYRHAFAYDVDFVEVDVRETADGVFVSMHDETVDRTTNGSGSIALLTWAEIQSLNAADFAPWKGSQYDPAPVPRLEEILELARVVGKGIEFDIKAVSHYTAFFDLVASYGVMSRSFFAIDGDSVDIAQAYDPEIRVIFNIEGTESAQTLFTQTRRTAIFGSRRDKYTPEKIAAIHDGCSFVLPHSYDASELLEPLEFSSALAAGADGAQVNQPDVIALIAQRHIPATLVYEPQKRRVCLRNASNSLGLPRQLLRVRVVALGVDLFNITDRDGCIGLPFRFGEFLIQHDETPAVRGAQLRVRATVSLSALAGHQSSNGALMRKSTVDGGL